MHRLHVGGTEELGHLEMVATLVHQLTRNLSDDDIEDNPSFAPYFVDHTTGIFPTAAAGHPWSAGGMAVTGDVIADLTEDMAADAAISKEQRIQNALNTQCFVYIRPFSATLV